MENTRQWEKMQRYVQLITRHNEEVQLKTGKRPVAHIRTFGCQQNVSDSEKISGMLGEMGYTFTQDPEEASLILYNTCAVRENAEDRIFGNTGALKHVKRRNPHLIVGLCGCMMQQPHIANKIKTSYPHVDICFGPHALPEFPRLLWEAIDGKGRVFALEDQGVDVVEGLPVRRDGDIKAWIPIMYGCDNFCTYCVVPFVRGRERSREPELIINEVRELVQQGYREFTLLGQNVNSYGKTLEQPITFAALLQQLCEIPGEFRIRFMTSHPKDCTKELIDTIAKNPKLCSHIHLPVQSGSDRVLSAMNRRYTADQYLSLIDYAKQTIPGVTFTSDIIVGFPGETREDFVQTLDLVRKVGYQSLFTFIYSKRVGTKAAEMEDPVSKEEKHHWFQELLDLQEEIGGAQYNSFVGQTIQVLAEGPGKKEGTLTGRSEGGIIVEFTGSQHCVGKFVDVKIDKSMGWALYGIAL